MNLLGGGASCLLVAYVPDTPRATKGHAARQALRLSVALLPRKWCSLSLTSFTPYAHRREVGGQHRGHVLRPITLAATGWVMRCVTAPRPGGLGLNPSTRSRTRLLRTAATSHNGARYAQGDSLEDSLTHVAAFRHGARPEQKAFCSLGLPAPSTRHNAASGSRTRHFAASAA